MKKCTSCDEIKDISNFQKDSSKKDGYRPDCKSCRKKYYQSNKHKLKKVDRVEKSEYNKKYYQLNKEAILNKKLKYWLENKEKINDYTKENKIKINNRKRRYIKDKLLNDPLFKLKHNVRVLIRYSLKNSKKSKTSEILGCSYDYFKNYIESRFRDGMSWENHGQSIEEIYELNHYTNFQPLWETENKSKGKKLIIESKI